MKKSIGLLLLLLTIVSCQKNENKTIPKSNEVFFKTADLHSKVYYISIFLDTEKCIAYNDGCDCCDGKIIFLKNNTFVSNYYCIPDESYNTGTYEIKKNKLLLHYSTKEAIMGPIDEAAIDEVATLLLETANCGTLALDIFQCKKKFLFKAEEEYYSEDTTSSFSEVVNQYKKIGVWKLLKIKE